MVHRSRLSLSHLSFLFLLFCFFSFWLVSSLCVIRIVLRQDSCLIRLATRFVLSHSCRLVCIRLVLCLNINFVLYHLSRSRLISRWKFCLSSLWSRFLNMCQSTCFMLHSDFVPAFSCFCTFRLLLEKISSLTDIMLDIIFARSLWPPPHHGPTEKNSWGVEVP